MGFRFRKSINLGGGFKINISKSGIGYSWGFPGFRATQTTRGTTRKTYSIPGTGFSYVEEHSNNKQKQEKIPLQQTYNNHFDEQEYVNEIPAIEEYNKLTNAKLPDFEECIPEQQDKTFLKTLLLCLFLGTFGAHRFYHKKYETAIIQFILGLFPFTTAFAFIWAIIDLINILKEKYKSKNNALVQQTSNSIIEITSEEAMNCEKNILTLAKKSLKYNTLATVLIILSIIIALICPYASFLLIFIVAFKIYCKTKGVIDLDYDIDEESLNAIKNKMLPMVRVTKCAKTWRINSSSIVIDTKYSGGATSSVKRTQCIALPKAVFPFKSEANAVSFITPNETIIFLPDRLFVIQGTKIVAINYSDIDISVNTTEFIEDEMPPQDAKILGYTWQYVNKSGGPDRRFKNNRQIPICLYGQLKFKAPGLNTVLMFSNANLHNNTDNSLDKNSTSNSNIAKYVFILIFCIVFVILNTFRDKTTATTSNNLQKKVESPYSTINGTEIGNEPKIKNITSYSPDQIVQLPNHPRIGDDFSKVYEFQQKINDKRIKVTDVGTFANLERLIGEEELSKSAVLVLLKDPTGEKYLGEVQINVTEKTFVQNMNLNKALSLIKEYLPQHFFTYYKKDASYIKEGNGIKIYCYGARLNKKGNSAKNNSNIYLPFYYSFYIKHNSKDNTWAIYTDYSAYAGADVEWYKRYKAWNVSLNK